MVVIKSKIFRKGHFVKLYLNNGVYKIKLNYPGPDIHIMNSTPWINEYNNISEEEAYQATSGAKKSADAAAGDAAIVGEARVGDANTGEVVADPVAAAPTTVPDEHQGSGNLTSVANDPLTSGSGEGSGINLGEQAHKRDVQAGEDRVDPVVGTEELVTEEEEVE